MPIKNSIKVNFMPKYITLLRGINVGGNKKVPMGKLKTIFEKMDFKNVQTLLNTGNVLFESKEKSLDNRISNELGKVFGFKIGTIVVPLSEIEKMVRDDPFKKIKVHDKIRLYVTFLPQNIKGSLKIPYISDDKGFTIFKQTPVALFSVLDLTRTQTTDVMNIIDKTYGKGVTTRNWNTVLKFLN